VVVWSATEDKVAVGKIASFAVQCESSPQVQVLAPLRHSLPVTLIPATQPSTHNVQFTPVDVGKFILCFPIINVINFIVITTYNILMIYFTFN